MSAMQGLLPAFSERIEADVAYQEALPIVRANAEGGRIWLVGGKVFRTLASLRTGLPRWESDCDFLVERLADPLDVPLGWAAHENKYGQPKLVRGSSSIDLFPLPKVYRVGRPSPRTLEEFLQGTPLTVQAVAYDVDEKMLLGGLGIRAAERRTIAINDARQYAHACKSKGVDEEDHLLRLACSLGYVPVVLNSRRQMPKDL